MSNVDCAEKVTRLGRVKDLSQGRKLSALVANRNAIHPEIGGRGGRSAQRALVANWRLVGSKTKWCRQSPDESTTHSRVDPFLRGTRGFFRARGINPWLRSHTAPR
jgi:hypothetical protein